MLNRDTEFHSGYITALEEVKRRLTTGDGRTEAYEDTLKWVESEIKNA